MDNQVRNVIERHKEGTKIIREQLDNYMIPYANIFMLAGFSIAFFMAAVLAVEGRWQDPYLVINFILSFFFLLLILFKKKLRVIGQMKWIIVLLVPIGIEIIYRSAIYGNGIYLIIVATVLSIAFWNHRAGLFIFLSGLIIEVVVYLQILNGRMMENTMKSTVDSPDLLLSHIIGYVMVTVAIFIVFYSTRKVMILNMDELTDLVEEMKGKNAEIERVAYYDQLTQMPNRYSYKREITKHLESKSRFSLLVIDIKEFHHINSFLGTDKGDSILRSLGKYFNGKPGYELFNAHLGNNTFAFLYDRVMSKDSVRDMLQIQSAMANAAIDSPITLTTNCICIPDISLVKDYDTLTDMVDQFMSVLKKSVSTDFMYYDEKDNDVIENVENMKLIKQAVDEKLFQVYYQEKVDSRTGKVVGLEALARLIIEDRFISPGVFIPIVESAGYSIDFGWIIVEKVFSQYKKITETYYDNLIVSINVSAEFLASDEFLNRMKLLMVAYDIPNGIVELEITESMVIENLEQVHQVINQLRKDNIRIAVDDFGTGYSSLQYFSELPIDVVKIDKTFVDKILNDRITRSIVEAIIDIAEVADIEVVAEGVEEENQSELLQSLDCFIIQGYLYSKPKPI